MPQNQENQDQGNVGDNGSGGNTDYNKTEFFHQKQNCTNYGRRKDSLADLFTDDIGKKEGINAAENRIDHGQCDSKNYIENPKQKHTGKNAKQNDGSICSKSGGKIGAPNPMDQKMQNHSKSNGKESVQIPGKKIVALGQETVQQIHKKRKND